MHWPHSCLQTGLYFLAGYSKVAAIFITRDHKSSKIPSAEGISAHVWHDSRQAPMLENATSELTRALGDVTGFQLCKRLLGASNGDDRWHQLSHMMRVYTAGNNNLIHMPEGPMKLK